MVSSGFFLGKSTLKPLGHATGPKSSKNPTESPSRLPIEKMNFHQHQVNFRVPSGKINIAIGNGHL
jgi:hypothetical protein